MQRLQPLFYWSPRLLIRRQGSLVFQFFVDTAYTIFYILAVYVNVFFEFCMYCVQNVLQFTVYLFIVLQVSQPLQYTDEQVAALILPPLNQLYNLHSLTTAARESEQINNTPLLVPYISTATVGVSNNSAHFLESIDENLSVPKSVVTAVVETEEIQATLRHRFSRWLFTVLCVMFGLSMLLFTLVRFITQNEVCAEVREVFNLFSLSTCATCKL